MADLATVRVKKNSHTIQAHLQTLERGLRDNYDLCGCVTKPLQATW
jgi:hypothetical protein